MSSKIYKLVSDFEMPPYIMEISWKLKMVHAISRNLSRNIIQIISRSLVASVLTAYSKIWWLCLVPTSATRFGSEVGYRMAKIW